jgi:hypothetical protein
MRNIWAIRRPCVKRAAKTPFCLPHSAPLSQWFMIP